MELDIPKERIFSLIDLASKVEKQFDQSDDNTRIALDNSYRALDLIHLLFRSNPVSWDTEIQKYIPSGWQNDVTTISFIASYLVHKIKKLTSGAFVSRNYRLALQLAFQAKGINVPVLTEEEERKAIADQLVALWKKTEEKE